MNEFLRRFRECQELSFPLKEEVTNEYIESLLYKKSSVSADQQLYRDFKKEVVYEALAPKGETPKHLWQKYNAVGVVGGKKPYSYRQYYRRYAERSDSKQITFHIQRYRCKSIDSSDLLDERINLNRQSDLSRYRKRIKYYSKIQLLFIDDFAISRYTEEGMNILYHLIKMKADLRTSTLFTSQYSPDEWGNYSRSVALITTVIGYSPDEWRKYLSDEKECYGKLDGIRCRLTTGFTAFIEKA